MKKILKFLIITIVSTSSYISTAYACNQDGDCINVPSAHHCYTPTHKCVECIQDADCPVAPRTHCNTTSYSCVAIHPLRLK